MQRLDRQGQYEWGRGTEPQLDSCGKRSGMRGRQAVSGQGNIVERFEPQDKLPQVIKLDTTAHRAARHDHKLKARQPSWAKTQLGKRYTTYLLAASAIRVSSTCTSTSSIGSARIMEELAGSNTLAEITSVAP